MPSIRGLVKNQLRRQKRGLWDLLQWGGAHPCWSITSLAPAVGSPHPSRSKHWEKVSFCGGMMDTEIGKLSQLPFFQVKFNNRSPIANILPLQFWLRVGLHSESKKKPVPVGSTSFSCPFPLCFTLF